MIQICNVCNIEKPLSDFSKDKNRPKHRKTCKRCRTQKANTEEKRKKHAEYLKKRRKEQPDLVRQQWERHVYGVCKEDLGKQECSICGSTQRLCIDHCHDTKIVRGLLCTKCNAAIGMFDEDIDKMISAIAYIKSFKDDPHFERRI